MFKVTPIGSCRITGPLRDGQVAHGIELNLDRCYGYCHSPAEAVQMARFMAGDANIPEHIWPLVSRSTTSKSSYDAQPANLSDLYVVELASAKELTVDGISIQLNYLNATFPEFFSEISRAQEFWELASGDDRGPVTRFLERNWSTSDVHLTESETLSRISLRMADRESLCRDIAALAELLPEILFVSHVDAVKADGKPIPSRSRFISLVEDEARNAGFPVFNPTDLMAEFGQSSAIEDHSTSLAHFTPAFSKAIVEDWVLSVIAPLTDKDVVAGHSDALGKLERQISADQAQGRHAAARARLEILAKKVEAIAEALGRCQELADAANANFISRIDAYAAGSEPAPELSTVFDETVALGQIETARNLANLPTDEPIGLPNHLLMKAARQALRIGEDEFAFDFSYSVLARAPETQTARRLVEGLLAKRKILGFARLEEGEARRILAQMEPAARLTAIQTQNEAVDFAISVKTTEDELAHLVTILADRDAVEDAIMLMAKWRAATNSTRIRHQAVTALLDDWVNAALAMPNPAHRVEALAAIKDADPRHKILREALQAQKVDFMRRVRQAGKSGDHSALEQLRIEAEHFPMPLPEFQLWRARLRFGSGDFEEALELGRAAARDLPETINVWVLLMRAAVKLQKNAEASEFATQVIDLACGKTKKFRDEAEAVLNAHMVGG